MGCTSSKVAEPPMRRSLTVFLADENGKEATEEHEDVRAWMEALNKNRSGLVFATTGDLPCVDKIQDSFAVKRSATYGAELDAEYEGVAYDCRKGLKPESPNQDDFVVLKTKGYSVFGVFDGHGKAGHVASNSVARTLPVKMMDEPDFYVDGKLSQPKEALKRAFKATNDALRVDSAAMDDMYEFAGTTASVVVLQPQQKLWVAWVGDSPWPSAAARSGGSCRGRTSRATTSRIWRRSRPASASPAGRCAC